MNCSSLGRAMWERAGLICFILDAHRSVLPTKLLHPTSDRSTCLHNALALYRPRQKLPFNYLVRRPSQRTVSACLLCRPSSMVPRQCPCFCPLGACKRYLSAHSVDGNRHGHAISLLLPSLITSINRLRYVFHDNAPAEAGQSLKYFHCQVPLTRLLPPADPVRFSHCLSVRKPVQ